MSGKCIDHFVLLDGTRAFLMILRVLCMVINDVFEHILVL